MTLPHNTRSEPANRQRARSPSMDSVKKNLRACVCDVRDVDDVASQHAFGAGQQTAGPVALDGQR